MRTRYSYINHDGTHTNVKLEPESHLIKLIATQDIMRGEEILLDYRLESLHRSYFHVKNASYLLDVEMEKF